MQVQEDGSIKIFQDKSKTDQEGMGVVHTIPKGKNGKLGPVDIIQWFLNVWDVPEQGYVFCKLKHDVRLKEVVPDWRSPVGYDMFRKQFKIFSEELGLPSLDIHSCRIGGASESSRLGARREVVKRSQLL